MDLDVKMTIQHLMQGLDNVNVKKLLKSLLLFSSKTLRDVYARHESLANVIETLYTCNRFEGKAGR